MNENINLCEILKGFEGIELYSSVNGEVKFCYIKSFSNYPIKCTDKYNNEVSFTIKGKYIEDNIGECVLFPSKEQRDWSKFERPIPIGTPMMCRNKSTLPWTLCLYKGVINGKHCVEYYTNSVSRGVSDFNYMVPFDKFNPNNIEESLKYNIQK